MKPRSADRRSRTSQHPGARSHLAALVLAPRMTEPIGSAEPEDDALNAYTSQMGGSCYSMEINGA
eukprot:6853093-Prymnesium_polylepis.1